MSIRYLKSFHSRLLPCCILLLSCLHWGAEAQPLNGVPSIEFVSGDVSWMRADFSVGKNTPGLGCLEACADDTTDRDMDGLNACVEDCYGTLDLFLDSDADGMPDSFETRFGLDPLRANAQEDPDGDLLTNVFEYLGNSSPVDRNSPAPMFFVSPGGADSEAGGDPTTPWRTVAFAMSQLGAKAAGTARIAIRGGVYAEDIILRPGVQLVGEGPNVVIEGSVTGAAGGGLSNLELRAEQPGAVLLDMNNVAMELSGVVFRGFPERDGTGILVDGTAPVASEIDRCTFTGLNVGIDIGDAIPMIRRCIFTDIGDAGIIIRAPGSGAPSNDLGSVDNPRTGWNSFDRASISGFAVINERPVTIPMQLNDWGTDDPEEIANLVQGRGAFEPFKAAGSGILAASLYCTVWLDQVSVSDATVDLQVSGYPALEENTNGVYAYPCLDEGTYTLHVSAPGEEPVQLAVDLLPGEFKSVTVALGTPPEEEPRRRFCNRRQGDEEKSDGIGDLALAILFGGALLGWRRR